MLDVPRQGRRQRVPPRAPALGDRGPRRRERRRRRRSRRRHRPPVAPPAGARAAPRRRAILPPPAATTFPDDWFLRRGEFARGALHDTAWEAELDVVTRWLDDQPLAGRIEEPAAGVGFFSPLIAAKGELHVSDPDGAALDRARDRLVAHRLLAHIHVADPWVVPAATGRARRGRRCSPRSCSAASAAPASTPPPRRSTSGSGPAAGWRRSSCIPTRPAARPDGIPWTWHDPGLVDAALRRAGFRGIERTTSGRFFLLASAEAG